MKFILWFKYLVLMCVVATGQVHAKIDTQTDTNDGYKFETNKHGGGCACQNCCSVESLPDKI